MELDLKDYEIEEYRIPICFIILESLILFQQSIYLDREESEYKAH